MGNLAHNVRRYRHERRWSQVELMRRSGVSSVKQIETGLILSPWFRHLEALASALGVTVSQLFAEGKKSARRSGNRNPPEAPARSPRRQAKAKAASASAQASDRR